MEGRSIRVFAATFLVAAVVLSGAWLAVDGLANLDEFLASAEAEAGVVGVARVAARYYAGVVRLQGGTALGAVCLASAIVAFARSRRPAAAPGGSR